MNDKRRINRKLKKIYKSPINNLYSHRFYSDLFTGYEFSISDDKLNESDFLKITPNDKAILKLFNEYNNRGFSYKLSEIIDRVLYSMAVYGKAYIFIEPEYKQNTDGKGNVNKIINTLKIDEIKGLISGKTFYYILFDDNIHELNLCKGTLIIFDLKDIGYERNYFKNLVKKIGENGLTYISWELMKNEPTYDFNVHSEKNTKNILKLVKDLGWSLSTEGLSDSYILYKQIQMKLFKIKMLDYVLEKINKALVDKYIFNKDFKIEASIDNLNYEDIREKFQTGEITKSELSKIVWV